MTSKERRFENKQEVNAVIYKDFGCVEYGECLAFQRACFDALAAAKDSPEKGRQWMIFCEHPHVYTLGKSGDEHNLLVNSDFLNKIGARYHRTDRGGDITYHGPGQLVGYPILDLQSLGMGLREYVEGLEEAVIRTLAQFGITAGRSAGATGVWLRGPERKICAIGVRASRYVTMHGFALNVNTMLEYFRWINPCGLADKGVTSMEKELGAQQDMARVKAVLLDELEKIMNIRIEYHGNCEEMGAQASG